MAAAHSTTTIDRRRLLAGGGAVAALAAGAAGGEVPGLQDGNPDTELIRRCYAFLMALDAFERREHAGDLDDCPEWEAVNAAREAAEELEPETLAGIRAVALVAKREAAQLDGSERWGESHTGDFPRRIGEAVLRLVPGPSLADLGVSPPPPRPAPPVLLAEPPPVSAHPDLDLMRLYLRWHEADQAELSHEAAEEQARLLRAIAETPARTLQGREAKAEILQAYLAERDDPVSQLAASVAADALSWRSA